MEEVSTQAPPGIHAPGETTWVYSARAPPGEQRLLAQSKSRSTQFNSGNSEETAQRVVLPRTQFLTFQDPAIIPGHLGAEPEPAAGHTLLFFA